MASNTRPAVQKNTAAHHVRIELGHQRVPVNATMRDPGVVNHHIPSPASQDHTTGWTVQASMGCLNRTHRRRRRIPLAGIVGAGANLERIWGDHGISCPAVQGCPRLLSVCWTSS